MQKTEGGMKTCDCFIGTLCGEEIARSTIESAVTSVVAFQNRLHERDMLNGRQPETAKQVVDGRKGYLRRFAFCPNCGDAIKWNQLLSVFQ